MIANPKVLAGRLAAARSDSDLRNRIRAADMMEPKDWQEAHDATVPYMVRVDAGRETEMARRRKYDQKLWDNLSDEQQQSAMDIREAFELIAGEVSVTTAHYGEQVSPGKRGLEESARSADLQIRYRQWTIECRACKVSVSAVLAIMVTGDSCRRVSHDFRKGRDWANANLRSALNLYCRLRGWPQKMC